MSFPPDTSKWAKQDFLEFAKNMNNKVLRKQISFRLSDEKKIMAEAIKNNVRKISTIITTSNLTKSVRQQLQELVKDCSIKAAAIAGADDS